MKGSIAGKTLALVKNSVLEDKALSAWLVSVKKGFVAFLFYDLRKVLIEKDGEKHFFHKSKSEWNMYFHSTIYTMKRCFYCNKTFGTNADFSVSDPWIPRYSKKDAIGHSIVGVTSSQANQILKKMEKSNRIKILEEISLNEFFNSQLGAVQKKKAYKNFYFYKKAIAFFRTSTYKNFFNKYPKLHNTINKFCRYFFVKMV